MKKVFRFYDNDDDGTISHENIWQAADQLDFEDELTESNVEAMIELADRKKQGEVDEADFLELMSFCGLIPEQTIEEPESENDGNNSSFERALAQMEEERRRATEKAELMKKKAAMGNTPAF